VSATTTTTTTTSALAAPIVDQTRLTVQAERAARVMMRKSPETQRTYQGIYTPSRAG